MITEKPRRSRKPTAPAPDRLRRAPRVVERARQQSAERFRSVITAMTEGLVVQDPHGTIVDCNPQAARMLGLTRRQLLGRTSRDARWNTVREDGRPFPGKDHPAMVALRTGRACRNVVMGLPLGRTALRWININAIPLFPDGRTRPQGVVVTFSDITERKQAEDALRESNALLSLFMQHSPIYAFIKELTPTESRVLLASENYRGLVGLAGSAMRGKTMAELFPAAFAAQITRDDRSVLAKGEVLRVDEDFRGRNYATVKFPITQGGRSLVAGYTIDITERKQAEAALRRAQNELEQRVLDRTAELARSNAALRQSQEQFRALAAHTPDHVFIQDLNLRYRLVINPQLGLTEADFLGKTDRHLLNKQDAARLTAVKKKVLTTGQPVHVEWPVRSRKGEIDYFEGDYIPKRDAAGRVDGLIGYFRNVTERHRADAALRKSEERYRALFDSSQDAFITLEPPTWAITSYNPAAVRIFRAGDGRQLGSRSPAELSPKYQPDGRSSAEAARAIIRTTLRHGSHFFEWRHRRLDGEEFPASVLLTRVELEGRALLHATVRDITERVQLEQQILNISEHERQRIARDLHDGLGQLLVGAGYLTNSLRKDLAQIAVAESRGLERVQELLNEAIGQARDLAHGMQPVESERNGLMVALHKLAARTTSLFGVRCDFCYTHPALLEENTVATHLFRIAQEAVTNAIKHAQPTRVVITLTRRPTGLKLTIRDNGVGLPAPGTRKPGMGLRFMAYRAGILGGSLVVRQERTGGTTVECRVRLAGGNRPRPGERKPKPGIARPNSLKRRPQ